MIPITHPGCKLKGELDKGFAGRIVSHLLIDIERFGKYIQATCQILVKFEYVNLYSNLIFPVLPLTTWSHTKSEKMGCKPIAVLW